ncbi:MAG: AAA family ATPase [Candidatus Electrothrix sp. Rat3]|nr:AAA family ATPase [Candidatus Electrothrix rattekaaiensis]
MKKLGLGIQALSEFRVNDYIYVDKTRHIHKMIDDGKYYFLSRPRRFGKSLLVDTIHELFSGEKALFEGCWIADNWDWHKKYPVLKISFATMSYQENDLKKALEMYLLKLAEEHGVQLKSTGYDEQFLELIETLGKEIPVAVLIDEYDKPIIDYLEQSAVQQALENREILKTFYAGVKDLDKYLRFFFITGVSKFSRVSIFSDLNHLTDITISKQFADVVGYTAAEIKKYYAPYLAALYQEFDQSEEKVMEEIIRRYNGYSWDGNTFVCNPYSIISLLYHQEFKNFWFETGTPTFLMKKFKETNKSIHASINKMVKESVFNKYDIENINTTALLFQTGYLTIKKYDRAARKYLLEFPNEEVREAFLDFAVEQYAHSSPDEMEHIVDTLLEALKYNAMDQFFTALQALFSSITARQLDKVKEYEGFYHSIIYIVLKMMGIRLACEVQSHFGSTDAVIWTEQYIYILEFKMGKAQAAVEQIKQKKYYVPYLADKREKVMVGFGFDKAERNLVDYLAETVE